MITRADVSRVNMVLTRLERDIRKDGPTELNRFLKDVGYRAMSFTQFATPAKIQRDLRKDRRVLKQAVKLLKSRGEKVTRTSISRAAEHILNVRKSRSKFRRAGWIPGILKLGGTIRGERGGVIKPGGAASRGWAQKATTTNMLGVIANEAYGEMSGTNGVKAKREMESALRRAVRFVTKDRIKYLRKKYHQMLRRNSDR